MRYANLSAMYGRRGELTSERDSGYLKIIFDRLEVCKSYRPKFGLGRAGIDYQTFRQLYSQDAFYTWFGLNNARIYSAHKVAGGITSIYRQIGLASEELIRKILQDELGLSEAEVNWSYKIASSGRARTLKLDGRISPAHIANENRRAQVVAWMDAASARLSLNVQIAAALQGSILEIRQGYKSKDAKRQNADMANAAQAYAQGYLPVLMLLSEQIDTDIMERYERGKWLVLRGNLLNDPLTSTFAFMKLVVGYDLAAFFERNSSMIRGLTQSVLNSLLKADDDA